MMKLTNLGRVLCDTAYNCKSNSSSAKIAMYKGAYTATYVYDGTELKAIVTASLRALLWAIFGLSGSSATSIQISYGDTLKESIYGKITVNGTELPTHYLDNSATASVVIDQNTGYSFVSGVLTNTTSDPIVVRYIGMPAEITFYPTTSSSSGGMAISNMLCYIELDEPVTIPAGGDYAFKISLDYGW